MGRQLGFIVAFTVPAMLLWWNVWAHPASTVSCGCLDSGQQVWFIAWPAYALSHALNPFFSSWLWTPSGVNLLNNTSAPLAGTLLAPVTWLFGPIASNSVSLALAPGLSAWACWLACRRFVTWAPAAVLAGLLFGYSPFVVTSIGVGHLSIALLVVPPLTVIVLHEIAVQQRWRAWVAGVLLGALVCIQFMISVEVLAMMGIAAGIGIVAAGILSWHRVRVALPYVVRAVVVAGGLAAVVLVWPSWYLLAGPRHITGVPFKGAQAVANGRLFHLWSSEPTSALGVVAGAPGDFVGVGVLVVAVLSLIVARRKKVAWVMAVVAVACIMLSWGPVFWVTASHSVTGPWLPWRLLSKLPIFRNILPVRFAIFTDLALSLLIAVGIDTARGWSLWTRLEPTGDGTPVPAGKAGAPRVGAHAGRVPATFVLAFALVAALTLVPQWASYQVPIATQRVNLPDWFATVGPSLPAGSTVLAYPFPMSATLLSEPMVWQAVDGMRFRLVGGYVKVPGPTGAPLTTGTPKSAVRLLYDLTTAAAPDRGLPASAAPLLALHAAVQRWQASWVVMTGIGPERAAAAAVFTAVIGRPPTISHHAWVWRLSLAERSAPFDSAAAFHAIQACAVPIDRASAFTTTAEKLRQGANLCVADQLAAPAAPTAPAAGG